jgi:hypothetical protein
MRGIIFAPIFVMLFAGFAIEIVGFAQQTSDRVVEFADDMAKATDCAVYGIELKYCSPSLLEHNFQDDLQNYTNMNEEFLRDLSQRLEAAEIEYIDGKVHIILEENQIANFQSPHPSPSE